MSAGDATKEEGQCTTSAYASESFDDKTVVGGGAAQKGTKREKPDFDDNSEGENEIPAKKKQRPPDYHGPASAFPVVRPQTGMSIAGSSTATPIPSPVSPPIPSPGASPIPQAAVVNTVVPQAPAVAGYHQPLAPINSYPQPIAPINSYPQVPTYPCAYPVAGYHYPGIYPPVAAYPPLVYNQHQLPAQGSYGAAVSKSNAMASTVPPELAHLYQNSTTVSKAELDGLHATNWTSKPRHPTLIGPGLIGAAPHPNT